MDSRREMIAAVIRDAITAGKYAPGDRVPTEEALAREHRVNRGTVHDAYGDLENEGIVGPGNGRAGRRVTVRDSMIVHVCRTESRERAAERATAGADAWTADVRDLGREPGQQLTLALEPATAAMAARLGLEPGAPVVIRRHVRTVDGSRRTSRTRTTTGSW